MDKDLEYINAIDKDNIFKWKNDIKYNIESYDDPDDSHSEDIDIILNFFSQNNKITPFSYSYKMYDNEKVPKDIKKNPRLHDFIGFISDIYDKYPEVCINYPPLVSRLQLNHLKKESASKIANGLIEKWGIERVVNDSQHLDNNYLFTPSSSLHAYRREKEKVEPVF